MTTEAENRKMEVITNHHWYDVLSGYELTAKERKEFDYLDDEEIMAPRFFRYRGQVYDLGEFMRVPKDQPWAGVNIRSWDGYVSDSYFSGVVVRFDEDGERIQVGTYLS